MTCINCEGIIDNPNEKQTLILTFCCKGCKEKFKDDHLRLSQDIEWLEKKKYRNEQEISNEVQKCPKC